MMSLKTNSGVTVRLSKAVSSFLPEWYRLCSGGSNSSVENVARQCVLPPWMAPRCQDSWCEAGSNSSLEGAR
ncbi:hypothetical protein E2C01_014108 [Portunus trituberculatus]|uniref:Uncharacterized protein n=1 Tax=Portunus trituberculatus TaxID=210409 RepID=A0A5B7DHY3_PORTR|nr:hypothetical protein [Portunus trituberculatus]